MPAKWIMWIPRPENIASLPDGGFPSLTTKASGWRNHVERKRVQVKGEEGETTEAAKYEFYLRYVDGTFPGDPGDGDVIYIFGGHGQAGRGFVTWPGDKIRVRNFGSWSQHVLA